MLKLLKTTYYRAIFLAFISIFLFSCQDDFLEIGSNLVDNVNYRGDSLKLPVTSYNQTFFNDIGVQTSALSSGALGIYKDPLYGETIASTLSQLIISPANPTVGENAEIDRIVVTLPYYSTAVGASADGGTEYRLDSVYGSGPMNIRGYRSTYFLSDNDPQDISKPAVYYSNQLDNFTGIRGDLLFSIDDLVPSEEEIVTQTISTTPPIDTTITRSAPALQYELNEEEIAYFKSSILDQAGDDVLFNQNSFKNYFRGLYLEAEPINNDGSYFLFDRSTAQIQIFYTADGSGDSRVQSNINLSLNPSSGAVGVVGYDNNFKPEIVNQASNTDPVEGDESLFLKGGQGSMAVVDLFGEDLDGDGIPERLEELRAGSQKLIREANLIFYVDQEKINQLGGSSKEAPSRIYIYDLDTNQPLADYILDVQTNTNTGVVNAVGTSHLGPLETDDDGSGVRYTLRITEHIKNLLNTENESPSTKLGVVVAQNLLNSGIATGAIQNTGTSAAAMRLPFTSILSQEGTILHGSASTNINKRLSLQLYFIETPNQ